MQLQTLEDLGGRQKSRLPPLLLCVGIAIAAAAAIWAIRGGKSTSEPEPSVSVAEQGEKNNAKADIPAQEQPTVADSRPAETAAEKTTEASNALADAKALAAEGKFWDARERLLAALPDAPAELGPELERSLGRLADTIYLTPRPAPGKVEYVIAPGDSLSSIASRFVCPVAFIMKANGIADASRIRPGNRLVFPDHPKFEVKVSKEANTLLLTLDGKFYKRYTVGTGRDSRTPIGTFRIKDRIEHPEWWSENGKTIPYGDPENILGTHWLALEATGETPRVSGYGIHGTWDESSLGKQSSAGCVRMRNQDVEELYTLLPRGTAVTITEAP